MIRFKLIALLRSYSFLYLIANLILRMRIVNKEDGDCYLRHFTGKQLQTVVDGCRSIKDLDDWHKQ